MVVAMGKTKCRNKQINKEFLFLVKVQKRF